MNVTATDLSAATALAVELSHAVGQPIVVAGALALAAHGYRRETSDVDIVLPVIIGGTSGDVLEQAAADIGLTVYTKPGIGLNLRAGDVRIDVLTLDRDVPALIPEAVAEAVDSSRQVTLFGHKVFVVSLGHLIAMKLISERKKDLADIVEVIKVKLEDGTWSDDRTEVKTIVTRHLGWYAARGVDNLEAVAKLERNE